MQAQSRRCRLPWLTAGHSHFASTMPLKLSAFLRRLMLANQSHKLLKLGLNLTFHLTQATLPAVLRWASRQRHSFEIAASLRHRSIDLEVSRPRHSCGRAFVRQPIGGENGWTTGKNHGAR